MKIESRSIEESINRVKELLKTEKKVPHSLKMAIEVLILVIHAMASRLKLNSSNSSKPPSLDPNRTRKSKGKNINKPGG